MNTNIRLSTLENLPHYIGHDPQSIIISSSGTDKIVTSSLISTIAFPSYHTTVLIISPIP